MRSVEENSPGTGGGDVLDFDAALLAHCTPQYRAELLAEATILAGAFAPEGRAEQLHGMARTLESGARDEEMDSARARLLAAALRQLARRPAT